jgi:LysM domain-containing protein
MPPAVGYVTIRSSSPPTTLTVRLGEDRPTVSAGYGGWDEIARPRRVGVVTWTGSPVRRMDVSVLFDTWAQGTSVEDDIAALDTLARPRRGGSPPTITLDAAGSHLPYKGLTWVIEALAWGDALMNVHGNRTRQAATLSLLEYVSDQLVQERSPANRRQAKAARKTGQNTKKSAAERRTAAKRGKTSRAHVGAHTLAVLGTAYDGEDLVSIAARELGDPNRWREIADLNGLRDPRAIVVGQVLRLP